MTGMIGMTDIARGWMDAPPDLRLRDDDAHIWLVDVRHLPGDASAVLSPAEQRRARAFHFEPDRIRFVASHTALRRVLAAYLSIAPEHIAFASETLGKPIIVHGPTPRARFGDARLQ